jgi:hypothetical protein
MLKVRSISSSSSLAAPAMTPKSGGTFQPLRWTMASTVLGRQRSRFSVMPPPVMCAIPLISAPSLSAASTGRT